MKERYDQKIRVKLLDVGDKVLLYDMMLVKQWDRKLEEQWLGPYTVKWKGQGAYSIEDKSGKVKMVSGDHLKAYNRRIARGSSMEDQQLEPQGDIVTEEFGLPDLLHRWNANHQLFTTFLQIVCLLLFTINQGGDKYDS